jgi:hypothetical protein
MFPTPGTLGVPSIGDMYKPNCDATKQKVGEPESLIDTMQTCTGADVPCGRHQMSERTILLPLLPQLLEDVFTHVKTYQIVSYSQLNRQTGLGNKGLYFLILLCLA